LLASRTIGPLLALIWLAPPPREGRGAFCGDGAPTASGADEGGSAACRAPAKTKEMIDPARVEGEAMRIGDLGNAVATWLILAGLSISAQYGDFFRL
jgi:hypothetical protein